MQETEKYSSAYEATQLIHIQNTQEMYKGIQTLDFPRGQDSTHYSFFFLLKAGYSNSQKL